MSRSAFLALVLSLAVHALLALAIARVPPVPDIQPELDLTDLEMELPGETAAKPCASVASERSDQLPAAPRLPSPSVPPTRARPPEPAAARLREPELEIGRLSAPKPADDLGEKSEQAHVEAPPRPRRTICPDYPKGARRRGEEGNVVLEIEVGADGACASVRVVASSGYAELDEAAVKASLRAKFLPALSGGKAVSAVVRLPLTFRLTRFQD